MREIDHIVILTRRLADAAKAFEGLGFHVCPLMRHPFGTANRLVMFGSTFIELLGIEDPEKLTPSFKPFQDFLEGGEGAYALALRSDDAPADQKTLSAAGVGVGEIAGFRRAVRLPDGRDTEAVVSTVWAEGLRTPRSAYFLSQQHNPEAVWVKEWSIHDNTAYGLSHVQLLCAAPQDRAKELQAFFAPTSGAFKSDAVSFDVKGIRFDVSPLSAAQDCVSDSGGEVFSDIGVTVKTLTVIERILNANGILFDREERGISLRPPHCGALRLHFEIES
ncbi:MAG: VOC family protein [Pseudomonadota bacterium]